MSADWKTRITKLVNEGCSVCFGTNADDDWAVTIGDGISEQCVTGNTLDEALTGAEALTALLTGKTQGEATDATAGHAG